MPITFPVAFTLTVALPSVFPVTFVVLSVIELTIGAASNLPRLTVTSVISLAFPLSSVAVIINTVPAFCTGIVTINLPSVFAFASPIEFVSTFIITVESASAIPVTLVDFSVTSLIVGILGAVTSFTKISVNSLVFPASSVEITVNFEPAFCKSISIEKVPSSFATVVPND